MENHQIIFGLMAYNFQTISLVDKNFKNGEASPPSSLYILLTLLNNLDSLEQDWVHDNTKTDHIGIMIRPN